MRLTLIIFGMRPLKTPVKFLSFVVSYRSEPKPYSFRNPSTFRLSIYELGNTHSSIVKTLLLSGDSVDAAMQMTQKSVAVVIRRVRWQ